MSACFGMRITPGTAFIAILVTGAGISFPALGQPAPPVSPAPVVDYEYDANGNLRKLIQAKGVTGFGFTTESTYDSLDRQKSSIDARQKPTLFEYNGRQDLLKVTDPRLLPTDYSRNGLGDVTTLSSPDTRTATPLTYDSAGNLKTRTDSRSVLATYSYDALNRLTSIVFSKTGSSSRTVGWAYDQTGAGFSYGVGRLTSTSHPDGSAQYAYDPQGRLLTDTQVVNGKSGANSLARTFVTTYTYDPAGNVTKIVYPSGRVLVIAYSGGLPSTITLARNTTATPVTLISSIQFNPFGAPKSWLWQLTSGTQLHERIFDLYGRPVRYRLGSNLRDITYDEADRIKQFDHYAVVGGTPQLILNQGFQYDELGRLTNVTANGSTWVIGYDDNGNRTSVTLNGTQRIYTTPPTTNRLDNISNPLRQFSYDNAGNTLTDAYTATYDLAGRMATLVKAGVTTTYTVDGQGKRVRKFSSTGNTSTVIYVYGQSGELLGEYDNTGKELREYVWLGDVPIAVFTPDPTGALKPSLVYYVHTDHLNAPRVVLDKSNNIRWQWIAEPFGTTAANENPAGLGTFVFSLRLPGQLYDQESGLHYNAFRDYDPSTGRYVQSDPIGMAGGSLSTYDYVKGNPLSFVDPAGLRVTAITPIVVPGSVIRPGNPGAPGGYGTGDPRASYPCNGVWSSGQCIPSLGPDSGPASNVIPFPTSRRKDPPANSCGKDGDPCTEAWTKLMEWKDILDRYPSVDPNSMSSGNFLSPQRFEVLGLRRLFNALADYFNQKCVPLGWAPITVRYPVGPSGPPLPGLKDLGDFYGR